MAGHNILTLWLAIAVCAAAETCTEGETCRGTAEADEIVLLQRKMSHSRRSVKGDGKSPEALFTYGSESLKTQTTLDYYRTWSSGMVFHSLAMEIDDALLLENDQHKTSSETLTSARSMELLEKVKKLNCPGEVTKKQPDWKLHEKAFDEDSVLHTLLRSPDGSMQYIAARGSHLLAADPPACAYLQTTPAQEPTEEIDAGGATLLDVATSDLVHDCQELFKLASKDHCAGKELTLTIKHAALQEVDGFAVKWLGEVSSASSESPKAHSGWCRFEVSDDSTDVSLLEGDDESVPEMKSGMKGTIAMHVELCGCEEKSEATPDEAEILRLLETYGMGELSLYKGFAHANANLPKIDIVPESLLGGASLPSAIDHREGFSMCYPDSGNEVVRNQGGCGSCWAFASATTTMHALCVSAMGSSAAMASSTDRLEVSVSQIMACNSQERGCQGGTASNADSGMAKDGITKEGDSGYMCGHGRPEDHFEVESTTCDAFPWGRHCSASTVNQAWHWGGAASITGETNMMRLIAAGHALYATFTVHKNFQMWKKPDVYKSDEGSAQLGGHAVTLMGYGTYNGDNYWHLQNSWGTQAHDGGYMKFGRGDNLLGIETAAFYMRASVTGGAVPPCFDGTDTGLKLGDGSYLSCSRAKTSGYCNSQAWYGGQIRSSCPVSCGVSCATGVGSEAAWGQGSSNADNEGDEENEDDDNENNDASTAAPTEPATDAPTQAPSTDAPTQAPSTDAPTEAPNEPEEEDLTCVDSSGSCGTFVKWVGCTNSYVRGQCAKSCNVEGCR